ncbi:MAG: PASTA domain-containing protein [Lachnospiraceae bacterium]|nr:PASTA domain-containing protein [Lachnospiraceae bacterium]
MKQCMGCMEIYQDNLTKCPICGYEEGTMPENTLHIEPGAILNNRYIVGKVLGYGGFGVTYIAWDTLLEQKVAIKEFLPSEYATRMLGRMEITIFSGDKQRQFMEGLVKFVAEAKKIAKFNNVPGIVKIFDCIEENNTAYIIMEYLDGETLAEKLEKEKKMKPDKAIQLLLPVMEALKKVNAEGIIHRDIAPDNIFITSKGEPKLIDFGAARYATTSVSRSLTIIIKPGYSPEEQYRSMADQGSWTDVYSIGATLYKMITGETPCDSMERRAYMEQHGTDMLKPISKFVNIDKNQETAIMNALNVKIQERTMNMGVLMEELTTEGDVQRVQPNNKKVSNVLLDIPLKYKLTMLAAIIAVVVGIFIAGLFKNKETLVAEGMTRVPNIRNMSIELAIKKLESCKLKYKITGFTYSTTIPANSVMTQSIQVGKTVKIGTEIELTVSKVNNANEMNNVLGMNIEDATKLLEESDYIVNIIGSRYDDVIAKDCIVKQDLDRKEDNKIINVVVSKGREVPYSVESAEVPEFVGTTFIESIRTAKEEGFLLQVTERKASKEVAEGVVMSQLVEAGTSARKGTIIELEVSKGSGEFVLGDFSNWEIDQAREYLTDQGMIVNEIYEVNEDIKHGEVFGQNPSANTKLKTGETVTLTVSIGPEEFEMVSLYKMTEEEAIQELKEYGLEAEVEKGFDSEVEDGCVYHQSIAKGTKTKVGEKVVIKVRDSSAEMELPKMIGEDIEVIEEKLKTMGFQVKATKEFSLTIESGKIISASHEDNSTQKVGTLITIVYSGGKGDIAAVSDVKNYNYIQAESVLVSQGLKVEYKFSFNVLEEGIVISQDIPAGEQASTGDTIVLTVSKGAKPTVTFASDPLKIDNQSSTQTYVTIQPKFKDIEWSVEKADIAETYVSSNPEYEVEETITHYVVVTGLKKGKTNLVVKIKYLDGSVSEHKCKLEVQ